MFRRLFFSVAYYKKPVWDTGTSPQELKSFIISHKPGKALDLGCGTGTNVITLAKAGWQVIGVDFAPRAIRIAQKKAIENRVVVKLLINDVTHLDAMSDHFDLILDIGCFHSLPPEDHSRYIAMVNRLLAPRGTYLLYVFFKNYGEILKPGVTEEDILRFLQVFKQVNRVDGTERDIHRSAWFSFQKFQQ